MTQAAAYTAGVISTIRTLVGIAVVVAGGIVLGALTAAFVLQHLEDGEELAPEVRHSRLP